MRLRTLLWRHLSDDQRDALERVADLESQLEHYVERGRVGWPALDVAEEALLAHLARHLPPEEPKIDDMHAADMYLACGCVHADAAAVAAFQQTYGGTIRRAIAKTSPIAQREELTQSVAAAMLAGEPPALAKYGGRGKLKVWVQVFATRHAGRRLKRKRPDAPNRDELLLERAADAIDPELEVLRQRYRAHFGTALQTALDQLDARDRNMLRHELIERLSLEKTGARYGVHRATAARWRAASRTALLQGVRRYFQEHHGVNEEELRSILRLIRSQLELSLSRMLAPRPTMDES